VQIKSLLAALILTVSPALLADDVLDIEARLELGRELLIEVTNDASTLVQAQSASSVAAAITHLEYARNQGASNAAYQLGFLYLAGQFGIAVDHAESRSNYELAVAQELPIALRDYGLMLYRGHHFHKDRERGSMLLTRAAELGDRPAIAYLIHLLRETTDEQDAVQASAWYESLGMRNDEFIVGVDGDPVVRAQDYAIGQAYISVMFREGVILKKNLTSAETWFDRIDPEYAMPALDDVAAFFSGSFHVRSDQHLARSMQEIALSSGHPTIINNYSWLLATARSDELRDGSKAVRLMEEVLDEVEPQAFMVDTMAAAYAEAGDFEAAIAEQIRANELFTAEELNPAVGLQHLEAYREGRAWRE